MKTTDFEQFNKMVKQAGYVIKATAKHHAVFRSDGTKLMGFAVSHRPGQKRCVLNVYVKRVMQAIQEDSQDE